MPKNHTPKWVPTAVEGGLPATGPAVCTFLPLDKATALKSAQEKLNYALRVLLAQTNELVQAYLTTLKKVGTYVFPAGLAVVGGALTTVLAAPYVASHATTLVNSLTSLLQTSGAAAFSQQVLSCVSHCLGQVATYTAMVGQSLLNLAPQTADLGVTAAKAVGASVLALLSAISATLLAPVAVNTGKFVATSVVSASHAVGNKVTSVVGNLRDRWASCPEVDSQESNSPKAVMPDSPKTYAPSGQ